MLYLTLSLVFRKDAAASAFWESVQLDFILHQITLASANSTREAGEPTDEGRRGKLQQITPAFRNYVRGARRRLAAGKARFMRVARSLRSEMVASKQRAGQRERIRSADRECKLDERRASHGYDPSVRRFGRRGALRL